MKKYLIFILLLQSCLKQNSNQDQSSASDKSNNTSNADSIRIINALYKDVKVLDYSIIGEGRFTHEINRITNKITATIIFKQYSLSYNIVFEDAARIYTKEHFVPSEEYKYLESYMIFGGDTLKISNKNRVNDLLRVAPLNFWYQDSFGIHGRHYKTVNKEIILLRGLNTGCNGVHCTSYVILAITKTGKNKALHYINTSSKYPIDFENTFLIESKKEKEPTIFIPKPEIPESLTNNDFDLYVFKDTELLKSSK